MLVIRTQRIIICLLMAGVISLVGCGTQYTGEYERTIRAKRGLSSEQVEAIQPVLAKALEKIDDFVDKLHIKADGRYWQKNVDREFDGDWWVADDGRLAVRITHQNGKSLGPLISEGADRHWEIGSDGNLYRSWNGKDSSLEVVFVKQ